MDIARLFLPSGRVWYSGMSTAHTAPFGEPGGQATVVNVGLELISGSPTAQDAPLEEPEGHATGRAAAKPAAAKRMAMNFIEMKLTCHLAIRLLYIHLNFLRNFHSSCFGRFFVNQ